MSILSIVLYSRLYVELDEQLRRPLGRPLDSQLGRDLYKQLDGQVCNHLFRYLYRPQVMDLLKLSKGTK